MWTSCPSSGPGDGPDLLGTQQRVLRVHVLPEGGRQEEAAHAL